MWSVCCFTMLLTVRCRGYWPLHDMPAVRLNDSCPQVVLDFCSTASVFPIHSRMDPPNQGKTFRTARFTAKAPYQNCSRRVTVWVNEASRGKRGYRRTLTATLAPFKVSAACRRTFQSSQHQAGVSDVFLFRRATAVTTLSALASGSANATVTFDRVTSLSVQAVGTYVDSDGTPGPSTGDTISYVFHIENNGTTTLWGVEVGSELGGGVVCVPPVALLELAPGSKTECSSTYVVRQPK